LFRENSKAYEVFKSIPAENIFLETDDAGYSIQEIYEQASLVRKIPVDALKLQILDNFARCFKITGWKTG
jgi:TatD DNase family protein